MRLAMELAGGLHDEEGDVELGETTLELLEPMARVGNAKRLANWMHMDVEPGFTDVDTGVDSSRSASFERDLALHTGLAPHHLFRTSAKARRTKLSRGSKPRVVRSRPADPRGVATPRGSTRNHQRFGQNDHARGRSHRAIQRIRPVTAW